MTNLELHTEFLVEMFVDKYYKMPSYVITYKCYYNLYWKKEFQPFDVLENEGNFNHFFFNIIFSNFLPEYARKIGQRKNMCIRF